MASGRTSLESGMILERPAHRKHSISVEAHLKARSDSASLGYVFSVLPSYILHMVSTPPLTPFLLITRVVSIHVRLIT